MSERTTIGGTVYEAIGSSSSNLLLKCNGTARIQWGGKLIDLIKNGKIASEDSKELIFIISDESEIQSDGIYLLTTQESNKLWISKDGNKYDLTNADLYISASKPQTLTADQKKQALDNIGLNYNSLEELQSAKIQNGLAYVLSTKTLYTIKDGVIEEFGAKLNTAVNKLSVEGDVISGNVKLVLSVLDDEYLILADKRITANYSIHVKDSAQLGSENADATQGYRLYMDGGTSYLDVDEINVRNGIDIKQYKEITFDNFSLLLEESKLEPHMWYLITDYQNPWKLAIQDSSLNRPILVRAVTENTLYEKGYLFRDHRITIKYDPTYQENITQKQTIDGVIQEVTTQARGKIIWMKDQFNNEANFDFLDYIDSEGNELATLHDPYGIEGEERSIFPTGSYNNKLVVYDLKGTILKEGKFDNTNTTVIDFKFDDQKKEKAERAIMNMHDNDIECRGLVLNATCTNFCNNTLKNVIKLEVNSNDFYENKFLNVYYHSSFANLDFSKTAFSDITDMDLFIPVVFNDEIYKSKCSELKHCSFSKKILESTFGSIENCDFTEDLDKFTFNLVQRPNDSYRYTFLKITNSTIDQVLKEVVTNFEMVDSYLGIIEELSEFNNIKIDTCVADHVYKSIISKDLTRSNFKLIKESQILEKITDSTVNEIIKSIINDEIIESTFEIIEESEINKKVIKSSCIKIHKSFINGEISESTFELISNSSDIQNKITESSIITLDKAIIKNIINISSFNLIKNSEISGDIDSSIFGDISDSYINNKINKSNIKLISQNTNINEEILNSIFNEITNSTISGTISDSRFNLIKSLTLTSSITSSVFDTINNSTISAAISNSTFTIISNLTSNASISNSIFLDISDIVFNASFDNVKFKKLSGGSIGEGTIAEAISFYDLTNPNFNQTEHPLLYITSKRKEIYIHYGKILITCIPDVVFYRGMIIMHSGVEPIPLGWALCDGNEYEFDGRKIRTPDLRNRFIRATETLNASEVKATDNKDINDKGELIIQKDQLPKHKHEIDITKLPQYTTDEIEGNTSRYDPQSQYVNTDSGTLSVGVSVSVYVSVSVGESSDSDSDSSSDSDSITLSGTTLNYLGQGNNYESIAHKHKINWGANNLVTEENDKADEQKPIKPIPNYYSLIFIMKL